MARLKRWLTPFKTGVRNERSLAVFGPGARVFGAGSCHAVPGVAQGRAWCRASQTAPRGGADEGDSSGRPKENSARRLFRKAGDGRPVDLVHGLHDGKAGLLAAAL